MERSFFGSLKSRLSRRNSTKSSTTTSSTHAVEPPRSTTPFTNTSPPTRRPNGRTPGPQPAEPPPAYSATAERPAPRGTADVSDNDPYAFLSTFDTVFVIDDSGSMVGRSWRETENALKAVTPICVAHDSDGIDLYFLNAPDNDWYKNITTPSTVHEIFSTVRPRGATPLGVKLHKILKAYLTRCERDLDGTKPMNIIVITDGEPTDDPESVIVQAARKLNKIDAPPHQVGIQFCQVGREAGARAYLQKLDDEMKGLTEGRDMVDTQKWQNDDGVELNADGILKTVLGGVNKSLDNNKRLKELHRR